MDKKELETLEQTLNAKEKELNERKEKLDAFALKLKEAQEAYKQDKNELDRREIIYKQEIEDSIHTSFNKRVNIAIQKQTETLHKEQEALLNKEKEYATKEIRLEEKRNQLELKEMELENSKKELENNYESILEERNRQRIAEFDRKLEEEFNKKFKEKIDSLEQDKELLAQERANLREQQMILDAEKKAFESSKQEQLAMLEKQVEAQVDLLSKSLETERVERGKLQNEYENLVNEYGEYLRFKDRHLIEENEVLRKEVERLKERILQIEEEGEKRIVQIENEGKESKERYQNELDKIERCDMLAAKHNSLEIEHKKLQEQLREQGYYENQLKITEERLENLQKKFMGKEEQIKREKAIKQEFTLETNLSNDNKNKERDEIKWLENIESKMQEYGVAYPKRLLYAFHTALKTASMSPLSVLSGVSGTGKSELPKLYAHFGGFNFFSEAVQPTWDSPASMVGFYNTIEGKFDSTNLLKFLVQTSIESKQFNEDAQNPYGLKESMNLVLLDELNLAHIELYFAEFLSKFETKRGSENVNLDIPIGAGLSMSLPLDSNLLWVGTMNEDETTKSLSDKVLDRAFCLNFPRPKELVSRPQLKKLSDICDFKWLPKITWDTWVKNTTKDIDIERYRKITEQINEKLALAHRAIGHRVWQSMEAYMLHYPLKGDKEKTLKIAFEDAIVQKIMPKLRGIELHGEEQKALIAIKEIILKEVPNLERDFEYAMSNPYGQFKFNSAYYLDLQKTTESKKQ